MPQLQWSGPSFKVFGKEGVEKSMATMSGDGKLIELVELYPFLYDKKHKSFKDNRAQESAWKSIAQQLRKPEQDVMKRWHSLRKRFIQTRKLLTRDPSGSVGNEQRLLYSALQFLNEHVPRRLTAFDIKNTASPQPLDHHDLAEERTIASPPSEVVEYEEEYSQASSSPRNELSTSGDIAPKDPLLLLATGGERGVKRKPDAQAIVQPVHQATSEEDDGSMDFGRSMGRQLRLIRSPAARLQVQAQICALIADALAQQEQTDSAGNN